MTEHKQDRDHGLNALFETARADAPMPSAAFLARVLQDAEAEQQAFGARERDQTGVRDDGLGLWGAVMGLFGGWRGVGGMATAALAGVWIGFSGVDTLSGYLGTSSTAPASLGTVELLPEGDEFAALFGEEG